MIRILCVDDEDFLLKVCKEFLEMSGEMMVETAISARDALQMMSREDYDAIVSDYQMQEMSGIDLLKEIRAEGDLVPFILFTGRGREEVAIEALNNGADFYLQKGGDSCSQFKELEHKVKEAVRRNRAEKALKLNEARLSKAQAIGRTGCWEYTWGAEGSSFWGSEESFRIFGIPRTSDGIIPQDQLETVIVERDRVRQERQDFIEKGTEYNVEYEIAPADGGPHKFIHSVAELERDEDGRPIKVIGIIQDVTELRKSDARLRRMNRELMAIKECGRALVKARTEQDLLNEVCRIVCEVAGYRLAWIGMAEHDKTRSIRPVAWSGFNQEYVRNVRATWGEDERGCGPTGICIKTGRTVFIQDFAHDARMDPWRELAQANGYESSIAIPLLDSGASFGAFTLYSGNVNGFTADEVALLEEMTSDLAFGIMGLRAQKARERAEEAFDASESEFRALFEDSPDAISLVGTDGKILNCNQAAARMVLIRKEEIIGGTISDMGVFSSDDLAMFQQSMIAKSKGEPAAPITAQVHRQDGTVRWVEIRSSVVMKAGRVHALQIIARDFTRRKQTEEALVQSNKKLNLLSSITMHDIDNQMMVLRGNLALLDPDPVDPQSASRLRNAKGAAERISAMVQFTKVYEDVGIHSPIWQEVRALVARSAVDIPTGKVEVVNDAPAGWEVFADPLIQKVFNNLVDNAVRHGSTLTAIRYSVEERGDGCAIICEDDGRGVSEEARKTLFDRSPGEEHGLGLFLSREILSITGIAIAEAGEPGGGARFVLTVPQDAVRRKTPGK